MQIQNACWLADDGWFHWGTLTLAGGRISKLHSDYASDDPAKGPAATALRWPAAARRIDAEGLFAVPGLVDAHVHLREPGQLYKEGIANGTAAALKGGVTTLLDMPNNVPPCATPERFEEKRQLFAAKSRANYGLFLQATPGGPRAPDSAAGVKIYMAKSSAHDALRDVDALEAVFRSQRLAILHAEDETKFSTAWKKNPQVFHSMEKVIHSVEKNFHSVEKVFHSVENPETGRANRPGEPHLPESRLGGDASPYREHVHHLRRPRAAIRAALKSIETAWRRIPAKQRPRLVIAHCSTIDEVEWVARMKRLGHDVWAETCPHYFLYTQDDYLRVGPRLQVNPPLRSEEDRAAIYEAVKNGGIDFVSTDHAPHAPKEKESENPPSGIAGIEWLGPILLTLARRGEISWKRYLELSAHNAAECYGIPDRGGIREGAWADLAFVEATRKTTTADEKIATRAAWHPFPEFEFTARIRATMVNGKLAWADGKARRGRFAQEVACHASLESSP
jgi:dihydroorotase